MPADAALVVTAVTLVFLVFAVVLAWASRQTRQVVPATGLPKPKRRPF